MAYTSSIAANATTGPLTDLAKVLGPIAGIVSGIAAVATIAALFGGNSAS
ncbi:MULTISPECIES: hypothetical protein [Rhodococcus]|jgi:hypothetical protein|uniref:Uncharacterized protein n=3 Tax=Rhodococcus erythropolis group TaxID=2840174 RepID=A0A8I1DAD8_RHOER|nr:MULTISPECIES: hypothetical protein [Rhodococcus]ERB54659.1 hypothetical protein N806_26410 [Rhodococcus sp. P27]MBH5145608.1 hypothetical protein [Rhodococcus erythropolis]MBX9146505.1 hypothetical protein [Rhodococcus qingshengii]MCC4303045.1 hypothetical protein [Rhodococcus sp. 3-2]MCX6475419.1 hypothetical protein [Rhodococcus sp. (in: high G+C Gram-positive bacteria)]